MNVRSDAVVCDYDLHDLEYLPCKVSDVVEYEMGVNPRSGRGHQVL